MGGEELVNRRLFQVSVVLCHHNGRLKEKNVADADNDPLMSPEPASLFPEVGFTAALVFEVL